MSALQVVLQKVRKHPWRGVSHDADGRRASVKVNGADAWSRSRSARRTRWRYYREMTAALRSGTSR